jgi:uncharacterized membrane protein YfcA
MSPWFFAAAFLSDVVGTVVGFGSSTVFLPVALLFVDFRTALILVGFSHLFGNIGRVAFFRHGVDRRLLLVFGVPSVIFAFAGASLASWASEDVLKGALGVFLLAFSVVSAVRPDLRFPASGASAAAGGTVSGFVAGLIGTGGALRGAFLTGYRLPKERYIATAAAIAIMTDITRVPVYLAEWGASAARPDILAALFVLALSGSYAGRKLVDRLPQKSFRSIVLAALALVGAKFVIDGCMAAAG